MAVEEPVVGTESTEAGGPHAGHHGERLKVLGGREVGTQLCLGKFNRVLQKPEAKNSLEGGRCHEKVIATHGRGPLRLGWKRHPKVE